MRNPICHSGKEKTICIFSYDVTIYMKYLFIDQFYLLKELILYIDEKKYYEFLYIIISCLKLLFLLIYLKFLILKFIFSYNIY